MGAYYSRDAKVSRRGWGDRPWLVAFWQDGEIVRWARYRDAGGAHTAARQWREQP
jgi:hypothetical protein